MPFTGKTGWGAFSSHVPEVRCCGKSHHISWSPPDHRKLVCVFKRTVCAFAQGGNIVVMFAPHVGVDKAGVVGKCDRAGQATSSTSCGASIGAAPHNNQHNKLYVYKYVTYYGGWEFSERCNHARAAQALTAHSRHAATTRTCSGGQWGTFQTDTSTTRWTALNICPLPGCRSVDSCVLVAVVMVHHC